MQPVVLNLSFLVGAMLQMQPAFSELLNNYAMGAESCPRADG